MIHKVSDNSSVPRFVRRAHARLKPCYHYYSQWLLLCAVTSRIYPSTPLDAALLFGYRSATDCLKAVGILFVMRDLSGAGAIGINSSARLDGVHTLPPPYIYIQQLIAFYPKAQVPIFSYAKKPKSLTPGGLKQ